MKYSDDQIREAFSIAYFADYGHFLTHFAQAILHADEENFAILKPVALALIRKYDLTIPEIQQNP